MTREEAKDIFLNRGFVEVEDCRGRIFHADKWREACVVISEWLAQAPCDDCVSKSDVINYIRTLSCDLSYWSVTDEVVKDIGKLPPVTPTQRWIPVSERLPKEGETVLVCYQAQGKIAQSVCEWFDMPNRGIVWSTLCGRTPIAWMLLPEPYKEEMESEE